MKYANRDSECAQLEELVKAGKFPVFIDACQASGISSFIKEKMRPVWDKYFEQGNIIYIDAKLSGTLEELLFKALLRAGYVESLQKFADANIGGHNGSAFAALLGGAPYAGSFLKCIAEPKTAAPIYIGNYSSVMEEHLIPFLECPIPRIKNYLIIIDEVERIAESSYDFLVRLLNSSVVCGVLINTDAGAQHTKLESKLRRGGVNTTHRLAFDLPEVKLIKELGLIYGIELPTSGAEEVLKKTNQDIYEIDECLYQLSSAPAKKPLTAWEKGIISVLNICSDSINEAALIEIVKSGSVYAPEPLTECKQALGELERQGIIEKTKVGWILSNRYDPVIHKILENVGEQLIYKNSAYNFLARQDDRHAKLRYQLSRDIKCTTPDDARPYMRQMVLSGESVPDDVFCAAELSKTDVDHCALAAIRFCRERRYTESLEWIDAIPPEAMTDSLMAFRAILLNRVRRSKEAEAELIKCLERKGPPARQNLLGAFLISNYIHQERLNMAQSVYSQMQGLYSSAPMHGYLIRNAISAFKEYRGDLYEGALADFRADEDDFGYYTTLCNQGHSLCKNKDYEGGLALLHQAQEGLAHFPKSDLHIVYNDLGLCFFLSGQMDEAALHLSLAANLGQTSMPRLFSIINLACLKAVTGDFKEAKAMLESIEKEVELHKLDRVRQKYYINRLLVEYLAGNKNLDEIIKLARKHLDRYQPERTVKAINVYERFAKTPKPPQKTRWKELFSPCGLAYWYIDPLKLFSPGAI